MAHATAGRSQETRAGRLRRTRSPGAGRSLSPLSARAPYIYFAFVVFLEIAATPFALRVTLSGVVRCTCNSTPWPTSPLTLDSLELPHRVTGCDAGGIPWEPEQGGAQHTEQRSSSDGRVAPLACTSMSSDASRFGFLTIDSSDRTSWKFSGVGPSFMATS